MDHGLPTHQHFDGRGRTDYRPCSSNNPEEGWYYSAKHGKCTCVYHAGWSYSQGGSSAVQGCCIDARMEPRGTIPKLRHTSERSSFLKTSLPRPSTFTDPEKIRELAHC